MSSSNLIPLLKLTIYSITALIFCLLTWFNVWKHADVVRVGNRPELIFSTVASGFGILTSLVGWAGILLNNRSFLAIYTFFLWIAFGLLLIPGYLTYKKHTFNLQGKINAQWSKVLGQSGRARIQTQLACCGYFSPFVEATITQTCYSRTILPGCKAPYLDFEALVLKRWYIVAFLIVPVHIGIILSGLLCSNHVTYRFGKGMMPKAYRLNMDSMAVIMDNYARYVILYLRFSLC
jgi:Tetraspanin family